MRNDTACDNRSITAPVMMIVVGGILLVGQFVPELGWEKLWPLLMIGGGVSMLLTRRH
jgi:predicted DNA repair protein MutK